MSDKILTLKARFKSNSLSLYGILVLIFNRSGDLDSYNTVVSTFSHVYDLEPHLSWEKYEETILETKWKGNFNTSMTSSLMDQLASLSNDNTLRKELYEFLNNYDYDNIDISITDAINRIIHDKNLIVEIGIQELTPEEFTETKENRKVLSENKVDEDQSAIILPIDPILSPVKGKPIYELKIGDKIMARIIAKSDRANYFIDLMNLRVDNNVKPIPCELIDIKSSGKNTPIEILTQIGPGVYGKCTEEEKEVKLRIYDSVIDGPPVKTSKSGGKSQINPESIEGSDSTSTRLTYIIFGLIFFILTILILFIYYSL